jgi:hypothetical protein
VRLKTILIVVVMTSSVLLGAGYAAADGPAVSEPHPLVGAAIDAIGWSGTDIQAFLAFGGGGTFDGTGFYDAGAGVTYHFAAPKSLKRQRREDRL